jgi:hypothetical protein
VTRLLRTRKMYEFLEAEAMGYAIRLRANGILQDKTRYPLKRPTP